MPNSAPRRRNRVGRSSPAPGARRARVLIVGGGMVGATLGTALAGAGVETILLDREAPQNQRAPSFDGRASAIAWGSARALSGIGVWDGPGLAAHAEPIREIRVSDGPSLLHLHYRGDEVADHPLGFMVENRDIRAVLGRALETRDAATLIAPAELASLECHESGVRARLADGTEIAAELAVSAEGRNARLRREAGIAVTEWSYPQTGIVATVEHERPHEGVAHERFLEPGPFAMLPLQGNRSSIVWTEHRALAPELLALDDDAFAAELERRFGPSLGRLDVRGPRWSYPLALLHAERYIDRRLVLVGDAAHSIHPIAGQGLNLGLRDVAALAEILVDAHRLGRDLGDADLLERYQRWRRFDNVALMVATDALNRLFSTGAPLVRLARDLGLAAVNELPPLKRFFMRHAMGIVGELPRLVRGETL
ncbi:MAG TPA: UbiH/UbiF/VisC/COQ6 family ubiquinone biosynthesis hydroxylase [Alphaproteobacteria bacterium]|nr:UbiH/UbiF/VisC/COQ6 family ubiquinone biosynthesis hydroxylase [Alphaproteobacteria bacterium]